MIIMKKNLEVLMSNDKEKINWSELTQDKKEEILKALVKSYIDFRNQEHKKFMEKCHYELFTPFYIKWWHKLKLKFK